MRHALQAALGSVGAACPHRHAAIQPPPPPGRGQGATLCLLGYQGATLCLLGYQGAALCLLGYQGAALCLLGYQTIWAHANTLPVNRWRYLQAPKRGAGQGESMAPVLPWRAQYDSNVRPPAS